METILKQLPLKTDDDILLAHHISLQLAERSGITILEQISFVMRVTQHCIDYHQSHDVITFSITKLKDVCVLKAYTEVNPGLILVEIPQKIVETALVALLDAPGRSNHMAEENSVTKNRNS